VCGIRREIIRNTFKTSFGKPVRETLAEKEGFKMDFGRDRLRRGSVN
jgi:hypothetical protein